MCVGVCACVPHLRWSEREREAKMPRRERVKERNGWKGLWNLLTPHIPHRIVAWEQVIMKEYACLTIVNEAKRLFIAINDPTTTIPQRTN